MTDKKSRTSGFALSPQEFMILASLIGKSKHGYAISKDVTKNTDGAVNLSAATLYENLNRMLDSGLIERDGDKEIAPGERRKFYRASGTGEKAVHEQWKIMTRIGQMIPKRAYDTSI